MLLALKVEEGATSLGMWAALEGRKGKEIDSALELPRGTQLCGPILGFSPPEV